MRKKRIGIATSSYEYNYGSVLQSYATQEVINRLPDCKCEIINYTPTVYYLRQYNSDYQKLLFDKKKLAFDMFKKKHFIRKEQRIPRITGEDYDYCLVGSDQMWNVRLLKEIKEYFLPNVGDEIAKVSYATSIACSIKELYAEGEYYFKHYLSRFKAISVRERTYVDTVRKLTGKNCVCVLDPTLLLDSEDYENLINEKICDKPFLLFYWLDYDKEYMRIADFVNTIARKHGLFVIHSIIDPSKCLLDNEVGWMYYDGIEDFLWYIKNATVVVTNSYHGTLFSIQFRRPFYFHVVESMRSRFDTIIESFDIGDRAIQKRIMPNDKDIDFVAIHQKIAELRKPSMAYLQYALS